MIPWVFFVFHSQTFDREFMERNLRGITDRDRISLFFDRGRFRREKKSELTEEGINEAIEWYSSAIRTSAKQSFVILALWFLIFVCVSVFQEFGVDNPSNSPENSTSPCTSDFIGWVPIL